MRSILINRRRVPGAMMVALLTIVVLAGTTVGCGPSGSADAPEPIKIGAAGPYSGPLSKIGLDSLNAIKLAVEEVNNAGGIDGRMVEIVIGDDEASPVKAQTVAERFVADPQVFGVIGPMNSNAVRAALSIYDQANLVVISQSATNSELTDLGFGAMHRICPRDEAQGAAAARFIHEELGARRISIIDDKGTYGQGLADTVVSALESLGLDGDDISRYQIAAEDLDFYTLLTNIRSQEVDLIYLALPDPAQAAVLLKQMRELGMENIQVMGGDGLKEREQFILGAEGAAEGAYITTIGREITEVPEAAEFIAAFTERHGEMSAFSGQSYEATMILLDAISRAAQAGELTRDAVLQAVHETEGRQGILGFPVSFDERGDVVGGSINILQVHNDSFVEVMAIAAGQSGE